jgi:hypothetical protein
MNEQPRVEQPQARAIEPPQPPQPAHVEQPHVAAPQRPAPPPSPHEGRGGDRDRNPR